MGDSGGAGHRVVPAGDRAAQRPQRVHWRRGGGELRDRAPGRTGFIAAGTLGVALTLRRDARFARVGHSMLLAGAGFALFALSAVFALVLTTLAGVNPPFRSLIEQVALGLSAAAMTLGAILAAVTRLQLPAANTI